MPQLEDELETWLRLARGAKQVAVVDHRAVGLEAHFAGSHDEAVCALRTALEGVSDDSEVVLALAASLRALGRDEEALMALLAGGDAAGVHFATGEALLAIGRWTEAEAAFERALHLAPRHVEALVWLGTLAMDVGDDSRAVKRLERAIELDPQAAMPRYQLALSCHRRGDHARALSQLLVVRKMMPAFLEVHRLLAQVAGAIDDARLAAESWGEVLVLGGEDAQALYELGRAHLQLGEIEEARQALTYADELLPGCPRIQAALAECSASGGRSAEAVRLFRTLMADPRYEAQARAALSQLAPFTPKRIA